GLVQGGSVRERVQRRAARRRVLAPRPRLCGVPRRLALDDGFRMNELLPLGAVADPSGTTFRVWSTRSKTVGVRLFDGPDLPGAVLPLEARGDGHFELHEGAVAPGALYKFVLDGEDVVDP